MAVDMFLKISGIDGESQDSKHKDTIEIESFSWGITPREGDKQGKVSVQDFHFAKRVDKASPILMLSCATGKHISDAVLTCRKAGEKPLEFLVIKMTDILISSYQTGGSSGDIVPTDSFSLNFQAINVEYTPQREDGSADKPVSAGFNVKEVKRG
ncbi:MAG: type VI secretion system tube protein Hcp [Gaiellaceae bacterium]